MPQHEYVAIQHEAIRQRISSSELIRRYIRSDVEELVEKERELE
jgi:hypothetical protein